MDLDLVKIQLLRAVRGKRAQSVLSRRLGYSFNQVYRWESGSKRILWREWVALCAFCGVDLAAALRVHLHYKEDAAQPALLLRHLIGKATPLALARSIGASRHVTVRWLASQSEPPLEAVLKTVHQYSQNLAAFVAALVDIGKVPALTPLFEQETLQKTLHYSLPEIAAFLRCFDLQDYLDLPSHQEGVVGKKLAMSLSEERSLIQTLEKAQAIEQVDGKYRVVARTLNTQGTYEQGKGLRQYWLKRASSHLETLTEARPNEAFGYLVYSCNEATRRLIFEKYIDFYNTVRYLTANQPTPPDDVWTMSVQLFPVTTVGPGS